MQRWKMSAGRRARETLTNRNHGFEFGKSNETKFTVVWPFAEFTCGPYPFIEPCEGGGGEMIEGPE